MLPRPQVARHSGCPARGLSQGWAHQPLSPPAFAGHLQREAPGEPEGCGQPPAGAGVAGPGRRVSRPRRASALYWAQQTPTHSFLSSCPPPRSLYTPGTPIFQRDLSGHDRSLPLDPSQHGKHRRCVSIPWGSPHCANEGCQQEEGEKSEYLSPPISHL